jgi:hypothetical protein
MLTDVGYVLQVAKSFLETRSHIAHKSSYQRLVRLSTLSCIRKLHEICVTLPPYVLDPLSYPGSHALAKLPIGGYLCPSRSTRGAQVHHCSDGMFSMTPGTCLPQPHHVVLSVMVSAVLMVGDIQLKAREVKAVRRED